MGFRHCSISGSNGTGSVVWAPAEPLYQVPAKFLAATLWIRAALSMRHPLTKNIPIKR